MESYSCRKLRSIAIRVVHGQLHNHRSFIIHIFCTRHADAERQAVETAAPGPPKAKALKEVARRVERELEAAFKAAGCTDTLRFDPKLKETGMLDLKSTAYQPDSAVPKN